MEPLQLKPRQPVEEDVENWDDDDFMIDNDDLAFRSATSSHHPSRRDSHTSYRSDRESLAGDEERHVHLPGDDEKSTMHAISAAASAGIPIPQNIPPSALLGGAIKRLGSRKIKKIYQEDWGDDMEMPDITQGLHLKPRDASQFPEELHHVSVASATPSPLKSPKFGAMGTTLPQAQPRTLGSPVNLDRFRDDDDDDVFGDGESTIRASKVMPPGKALTFTTPPTPVNYASRPTTPPAREADDDFEADLELPSNGELKLTSRQDIPKTPAVNTVDDFDWGEGSLGTRFGGTRRDAFATRNSSAAALSPSISSSITAESEDETFDGLVLPMGPLDLSERLKRRKRQLQSPERFSLKNQQPRSNPQTLPSRTPPATPGEEFEEDDLEGLDLQGGDVLGSAKSSMHRNVKLKDRRPMSPARPKTAVSITFTQKPVPNPPTSRLPRPMVNHERSHTLTSLEPVSESGGPIPARPLRKNQARLGHSNHSSLSSVGGPTTPTSVSSYHPPTPRRELGQKSSTGTLRSEPTTTNAQLLRLKRSLPVMGGQQPSARPSSTRYERPISWTDATRPPSSLGPKAPNDRARMQGESSAAQARKNPPPFLPAGASHSQSKHVLAQSSRYFRRHNSDQGPEIRPLSRVGTLRSPSPRRHRHVEKMAAEPWQQLSKPRRLRQFGDGSELDGFDDLPTSAHSESRFEKQPVGSGNRTNVRNKVYQNVLPGRSTPSPVATSQSSAKIDYTPRFARDTTASRMARESNMAQRVPSNGHLGAAGTLTSPRVTQLSARGPLRAHPSQGNSLSRPKRTRRLPQLKPHLISNLSSARDPKG